MRVAITGGTGMIGTWLARELRERGDEVLIVSRQRTKAPDFIRWDAHKGIHDLERMEGLDAVVNLAGEPIAARPWTTVRRRKLWESRVDTTGVLLRSLGRLDAPPKAFIGVGSIGLFGDQGEDWVDENTGVGDGFLPELAEAWEQAQLAAKRVISSRTAVLRLSIVLSPTGGVFPLMLKPFRIGMGGWLGHGRQFTSWTTIRDTSAAFRLLIDDDTATGCFNGTIPEPTRNIDWLKALGRATGKPVITHAPRWALRGALGELADSLLIASIRTRPTKLLDHGFSFVDKDAEDAFRWLISEVEASRT